MCVKAEKKIFKMVQIRASEINKVKNKFADVRNQYIAFFIGKNNKKVLRT